MRVEQIIDITHELYNGSIPQEVSLFCLNSTQLLQSEVRE